MEAVREPLDFVGINLYTRTIVAADAAAWSRESPEPGWS
jgi:hypothetical protein